MNNLQKNMVIQSLCLRYFVYFGNRLIFNACKEVNKSCFLIYGFIAKLNIDITGNRSIIYIYNNKKEENQ